MAKVEIKREYAGKTASDCYQACLRAVPKAGYRLVKKRDIASLVICETTFQGSRVDLSLMVPMPKPTSVVLSISGEKADESSLKGEADRLLGILDNELTRA